MFRDEHSLQVMHVFRRLSFFVFLFTAVLAPPLPAAQTVDVSEDAVASSAREIGLKFFNFLMTPEEHVADLLIPGPRQVIASRLPSFKVAIIRINLT